MIEYDNQRFCPSICQEGGLCKPNTQYGRTTLFEKAAQVKKALDAICAVESSDCSKGLAVTGDSEGGFLSMLLSLLDKRISALLLMGVGRISGWGWPTQAERCISDEQLSKHVSR